MDNLIEFQFLSTLPRIRSLGDHLLDQYGLASSIGSQHIVYLTRNHPHDCLGKGIVWRVLELLSIKHSHILFWIIPGIPCIAPLNKMSRRHGCWSYVMWRRPSTMDDHWAKSAKPYIRFILIDSFISNKLVIMSLNSDGSLKAKRYNLKNKNIRIVSIIR